MGCSPWSHKQSDMTEQLSTAHLAVLPASFSPALTLPRAPSPLPEKSWELAQGPPEHKSRAGHLLLRCGARPSLLPSHGPHTLALCPGTCC